VTAPPDALAAHHRRGPGRRVGEHRVQRRPEVGGTGVRRVRPEGVDGPPGVRLVGAGGGVPPAAEALLPAVVDAGRRQPAGQFLPSGLVRLAGNRRTSTTRATPAPASNSPNRARSAAPCPTVTSVRLMPRGCPKSWTRTALRERELSKIYSGRERLAVVGRCRPARTDRSGAGAGAGTDAACGSGAGAACRARVPTGGASVGPIVLHRRACVG
jgi:hypothetical protein